jgi:hypothetical protein
MSIHFEKVEYIYRNENEAHTPLKDIKNDKLNVQESLKSLLLEKDVTIEGNIP